MKKKNIILAVKIFSVLLWLFTLVFPSIYSSTEDVKYVDVRQIAGTQKFEVEFTKPLKKGNVTITFFDENNKFYADHTHFFEDEDTKIILIDLTTRNLSGAAKYDFDNANVVTVDADKIERIMYPVSIICLILMFIVCRIRYKEYVIDERKVEIYSGVINHTIKVDNIVVHAEKYFLTRQKTMVSVPVSDLNEVFIVFRANNKIEVETRRKQPQENVSVDVEVVDGQSENVNDQKEENTVTSEMFEEKNSDEMSANNVSEENGEQTPEIQEYAVSEDKNVEAVQAEIEAAEEPRKNNEDNN